MSYIDNPYNSDQGKELLKQNLANIFLVGEKPNTFESEDKDLMVENFRNRTSGIITIMSRFVKGYRQIGIGQSYDSGIYVCPNPECLRRDFIYHWESVDLGVYSPKEWLGTVKLAKGRSGVPNFGTGKFVVMHRVRCNTVSTCNKCHTTFQGKVTNCQNYACNGGGDYMVTVGCGEEACGMHYIAEKTLEQNFPTQELTAGRGPIYNRQVTVYRHGGFNYGRSGSRGLVTEIRGDEVAFELIQPETSPLSGRPEDLYDAARATPTMRITYGAEGQTSAKNYPISLYRYGFSQNRKRVCAGRIESDGRNAHNSGRYDGRVWLTSSNGSEVAACPECNAYEPPIVTESASLLPPKSLAIENPQPLDGSADMLHFHQGQPVWQIYVSDPNDARERSNYLVPVAGTWNLQKIPTEVSVGEIGIGRSSCPNDVGFAAGVAAMKEEEGAKTRNIVDYLKLPRARIINLKGSEDVYEAAKKEKEIPELLAKRWKEYVVAIKSESGSNVVVTGIERAEDGNEAWELTLKSENLKRFTEGLGESGPAFTYAVCEGRAKAAFKWAGKWVDCSPPCTSFRNQDGTNRKTPRQYPRFNQYPQWYLEAFEGDDWKRAQRNLIRQSGYVPPDPAGFEVGLHYLWMDELSHLIMDPLRYGPIMDKAISNLQTYHSVFVISEEVEVDIASKTIINECRTCKAAYQAGGIEISRRAKGYVDAQGIVKAPFIYPQEVYELEIEYQAKFGMNILDKPLAWGIEGRGKDMLSNPTQIRID
jgi:hypothetical protein